MTVSMARHERGCKRLHRHMVICDVYIMLMEQLLPMKHAIEIDQLSVIRDNTQILTDVTLSVPEGKVVGLLGPSGAGKTTLMQAIMGLMRPSAGEVTIFGERAGSKILRPQIG